MCINCDSEKDVDPRAYEEHAVAKKMAYATATEAKRSESPLLSELERVGTLLMILENTFDAHQQQLQPLLSEQPSQDTAESERAYNPIWDTEAGQRLRQIASRIETMTERVSYTSRAVQV